MDNGLEKHYKLELKEINECRRLVGLDTIDEKDLIQHVVRGKKPAKGRKYTADRYLHNSKHNRYFYPSLIEARKRAGFPNTNC